MTDSNLSEADSKLIQSVRNTFRIAYDNCLPHWRKAQRYADAYSNIIDRNTWPTLSEIPIPFFWNTVEQSMPFMMDYLFPDENFIQLMPIERPLPYRSVHSVERLIEDTLVYKMRLKRNAIATIKDAMKMGVGYGIVEPVSYTHLTLPTNREV